MSDNRTTELREKLTELGVKWWPMRNNGYYEDRDTEFVVNGKKHTAHEWGDGFAVYNLTPEQAIAATLGSDVSATRLAERLHGIANEMRSVGASTMTPHELLAFYANEVSKVADSLTFAATLGSKTCEMEIKDNMAESEGTGAVWWECSSCHWQIEFFHTKWLEHAKFCPECGRKIRKAVKR